MTIYSTRTIPTTSYSDRTIPSTSYSIRDAISFSDSVLPIETSFWDDLKTWTDAGKFWHDNGNLGTQYTTRIIP